VDGLTEAVRSQLTARYGLEVTLKEPKPRKNDEASVAVDTWQITVVTNPNQNHRPHQRIKIDITTMESRTTELQTVQKNYPVLPSGVTGLLIPTMSSEEIMTNKLVSLPASACRDRIRYRDIWDITWLSLEGVALKPELVRALVYEFGMNDYSERAVHMCTLWTTPPHIERFSSEMRRFLPRSVLARTIDRPGFIPFVVKQVNKHLANAADIIILPKPPKKLVS